MLSGLRWRARSASRASATVRWVASGCLPFFSRMGNWPGRNGPRINGRGAQAPESKPGNGAGLTGEHNAYRQPLESAPSPGTIVKPIGAANSPAGSLSEQLVPFVDPHSGDEDRKLLLQWFPTGVGGLLPSATAASRSSEA